MRIAVLALALILTPAHLLADASTPGSYYVTAGTLNVRLAPSPKAKTTNKLYRQQRVDVFELKNGWARVSKFYDGRVESLRGQVARWVSAKHLSTNRPADLAQPKLKEDSRITGLPTVGEHGLTERDVRILHRGAKHFVDSGKCQKVEYGDKSTSKRNTYYVNCGEPRNRFFTPASIAD